MNIQIPQFDVDLYNNFIRKREDVLETLEVFFIKQIINRISLHTRDKFCNDFTFTHSDFLNTSFLRNKTENYSVYDFKINNNFCEFKPSYETTAENYSIRNNRYYPSTILKNNKFSSLEEEDKFIFFCLHIPYTPIECLKKIWIGENFFLKCYWFSKKGKEIFSLLEGVKMYPYQDEVQGKISDFIYRLEGGYEKNKIQYRINYSHMKSFYIEINPDSL